jgi:hypothetical protein
MAFMLTASLHTNLSGFSVAFKNPCLTGTWHEAYSKWRIHDSFFQNYDRQREHWQMADLTIGKYDRLRFACVLQADRRRDRTTIVILRSAGYDRPRSG